MQQVKLDFKDYKKAKDALYKVLADHFKIVTEGSDLDKHPLKMLSPREKVGNKFAGGKTVDQLCEEMRSGETKLFIDEKGGLHREVETVHWILPEDSAAFKKGELSGNILLELRVKKPVGGESREKRSYCVPGGKLKAGETPAQALEREFSEEHGITKLPNVLAHKEQTVTLKGRSYPLETIYRDVTFLLETSELTEKDRLALLREQVGSKETIDIFGRSGNDNAAEGGEKPRIPKEVSTVTFSWKSPTKVSEKEVTFSFDLLKKLYEQLPGRPTGEVEHKPPGGDLL